MRWLRIFPQYQTLEAKVAELKASLEIANSQALALQDKNRELDSRLEEAIKSRDEAILDGRQAREKVADFLAARAWGQGLFNPAQGASVDKPTQSAPAPTRVLGRHLAAELTKQAYVEDQRRMEKLEAEVLGNNRA